MVGSIVHAAPAIFLVIMRRSRRGGGFVRSFLSRHSTATLWRTVLLVWDVLLVYWRMLGCMPVLLRGG